MTKKPDNRPDQIDRIPIGELLLDSKNPRFAGELGGNPPQERILDFIADTVGVGDLLSSMSKKGYHRAHPLIGLKSGNSVIIVEGNRRLVAALILTEDTRAANQRSRARNYPLESDVKEGLQILPVLIVQSRQEVLPYLGIAHIVGNKKWDSYAKAAWAAAVLDEDMYRGGLSAIAEEIGDKNKTLERLVVAYRLIKQLEDADRFSPDQTMKKGKGIAKFPFSWVYTALGYQTVRDWLELDEEAAVQAGATEIIPPDSLDKAAELLGWMFGNRTLNENPLIQESRQIPDLAAAVGNQRKLSLLRRGLSIEDVKRESQPPQQQIADSLLSAEEALRQALGVLGSSGREITEANLRQLESDSRRVYSAAQNVYRQIRALTEMEHEPLS